MSRELLSGNTRAAAFPFALLVPTACSLPARPVALVESSLAGLLALGRVGDAVVMVTVFVALDRAVRGSPPRLQGFFWRGGRNQAIAAAANQVLTSCFDQGFTNGEPVCGLEKLHQRTLHLAVPHVLGDLDRLLGERVNSRVVKACGDVERGGNEVLDLIRAI